MDNILADSGRRAKALMVLARWLEIYDEVAARRQTACAPGCAACCTDLVSLTTLEGEMLAQALESPGQEALLQRALAAPAGPAPASTFNALARLCILGQEPPPEPQRRPGGPCPLLVEGRCAAYGARPLACRVMASRRACQPGGAAEQDPFWVSVDTVFLQVAEQLDAGGGYGPLVTVLQAVRGPGGPGLLMCENLRGLPTLPEHQAQISAMAADVFSRPLQGRPLGLWVDELRG